MKITPQYFIPKPEPVHQMPSEVGGSGTVRIIVGAAVCMAASPLQWYNLAPPVVSYVVVAIGIAFILWGMARRGML